MEKKPSDYGQPLVFFGLLIFLSAVSYYIEKYLGIGDVIVFVIWAILTLKIFIWISQKGFSYGHPASFFALGFTFTLVGFYIGQTLNIETFIWLVLWTIALLTVRNWINSNPQADKRLFYLLSIQFIALAIMIPLLLHYANQELTVHHVVMKESNLHSVSSALEQGMQSTSDRSGHFNQLLLSTLQHLIFILSVFVAISAWRVGRKQRSETTLTTVS